ncbi:MAG: DeoR/GlpR transcriptional regulator [Phycisphaerae bacterium]|jgi:DeoR/GlpR family transcriptional regulator of sugar metabolism
MTGDARRQQLSELLARRGHAELSELVTELGVSESTIRRDLSQLEEEGVIRRTHGGAVFVSEKFAPLNYIARESTAVAEKAAIGQAAAALVEEGETILLDGGTTTFQVARCLLDRRLQVVTNSLPIAHLLSGSPSIELNVIGGYIYPRTGVALGPMAVQALASVHVNKAFMGIAAATEDALFNANMLMVETELQMMRCAEEVVLVVDHSKFGRRGLARLSGWERIDRVVVDDGLDAKWQQVIREAGAELILAGVRGEG